MPKKINESQIARFVRGAVKVKCGELSAQYIGDFIEAYDGDERIWVARKFYADDDPVWNAVPEYDECLDICAAIIRQAIYDATLGEAIYGKVVTDKNTILARSDAVEFVQGLPSYILKNEGIERTGAVCDASGGLSCVDG